MGFADFAVREGLALRNIIHVANQKYTAAARGHRESVWAKSTDLMPVAPPLVVQMGPNGIHTESPYGPWDPGPPYSDVGPGPGPLVPYVAPAPAPSPDAVADGNLARMLKQAG